MERVINYFSFYIKLSEAAKQFLMKSGKIKHYPANTYYKLYGEKVSKWCFILDGLVAIISFHNQKEIIERFYSSHYYFSGTKNPFSSNSDAYSIKFLRSTTIYEIPNSSFKEGIEMYAELNNIYQILKQHEIRYTQQLISILNSPSLHRLHALATLQPALYNILTIKEKMAYLNISNFRYYYRALSYHLRF
jgi:signal-transduction protein with cAMP-binding, CBS, and nucleotidyltransferase domain